MVFRIDLIYTIMHRNHDVDNHFYIATKCLRIGIITEESACLRLIYRVRVVVRDLITSRKRATIARDKSHRSERCVHVCRTLKIMNNQPHAPGFYQ